VNNLRQHHENDKIARPCGKKDVGEAEVEAYGIYESKGDIHSAKVASFLGRDEH
jgi:hypothetical protein